MRLRKHFASALTQSWSAPQSLARNLSRAVSSTQSPQVTPFPKDPTDAIPILALAISTDTGQRDNSAYLHAGRLEVGLGGNSSKHHHADLRNRRSNRRTRLVLRRAWMAVL